MTIQPHFSKKAELINAILVSILVIIAYMIIHSTIIMYGIALILFAIYGMGPDTGVADTIFRSMYYYFPIVVYIFSVIIIYLKHQRKSFNTTYSLTETTIEKHSGKDSYTIMYEHIESLSISPEGEVLVIASTNLYTIPCGIEAANVKDFIEERRTHISS